MSTPRRLFLIDGSSQMYRAYHAPVRTAEGGFLRNAQGRPTNAVYIFVTMLRKLLNEQQPQYIAASFDLPGRTFRDDLVADYKANRAPMPDELAEQIPMVHAACEALGVPILTDLGTALVAPAERYSYVFEGNSQELDHIYVTHSLLPGAQFQPIHINAEFADQVSDHDPLVASLRVPPPPPVAGSNRTVSRATRQ